MRAAVATALLLSALGAAAAAVVHAGGPANAYTVQKLVSDRPSRAAYSDPALVNGWGITASPTGPWWTANEARSSSTLYSGAGRKQLLDVAVDGGPTGVAFYGGKGFVVRHGATSGPARFVYACEDGAIRAWTPTVPTAWSTRAEVVVDEGSTGAVFRGLTIAADRVYATDFHNDRVAVYDSRWRRIERPGTFVDPTIPEWYAPFGIQAVGDRIFVTYVYRAPVNGNDAPTGGYVDEYDLGGRLVARVGRAGVLNAPWGIAPAPNSFGHFAGDLLVANFGDGRINAFARDGDGWKLAGTLHDRRGKPLVVNGLWGIAFGNGGLAGPKDALFFASGPHDWRGETELGVHGLLGRIVPA
jgi:uncharacterized protein (TIGR03118 family)